MQGAAYSGHAIEDRSSNQVSKRMALSHENIGCTYPAIVKMESVFLILFGHLSNSELKRD